LELNLYLYFVLAEGELERTAEQWHKEEPEITADFLMESPHAIVGTVSEMVQQLQTTRERFGISYITVQEHYMKKLAPVVAALAGR
jgi:hypothetical protein